MNAHFQYASSDGSRVFFTDAQSLVAGAPTGGQEADQLYVAEISGQPLHVAVRYLAGGRIRQSSPASAKMANTFTSSPPASCMSTILWGDDGRRAIGEGALSDANELGARTLPPSSLSARVSPDGRYFAFMSTTPLTQYDTTDLLTGKPDEEVYLYDATTGGLRCISCAPSGAPPSGLYDHPEETGYDTPSVDENELWQGWERVLNVGEKGWLARYPSGCRSTRARPFTSRAISTIRAHVLQR